MMLVTLQQASDHVRRDTNADDADLTLKIHAASGAVLNYLKSGSPYELERNSSGVIVEDSAGRPIPVTDSNGDPVVLFEVRAAVLLMVGYLYRLRDDNEGKAFEPGYLPAPVTALLYPLRDPALA
jgi:hypothetical protein